MSSALLPCLVYARLDQVTCGTHLEKTKEELFLHRQAFRHGKPSGRIAPLSAQTAVNRDAGEIALIGDSNGVVVRRNPFDLDQKTLRFLPATREAASYRFELTAAVSYDPSAVQSGTVQKLGDDESAMIALPFAFPFFGKAYQQIFINSDGNLTFTAGDAGSTDRSFGRFTGGVPRIAPLFADLDPSRAQPGVVVASEPDRFVVSWVSVPLYSDSGLGRPQTFQLRLYAGGQIEFTWLDVDLPDAVVGIAPGRAEGISSMLSFSAGSVQSFDAAIGERFAGTDSVDIVTAAQQFYKSHEDAYDYLVVFNAENLAAAPGAVAYEITVRNQRTGYGDQTMDIGRDFGSHQRLQAVLNMGPLNQYPLDPSAIVPARFLSRDTPMTVLGHEAGHLFLAYASVKDPNDPNAKPMLGRQLAHWSFLFNSEASLLEGNRIRDNGPDTAPRFTTTATVEGYAPLDQYLMGFRAADEVPPTFLVTGSPHVFSGSRSPQVGVSFDGTRRDISIQDLIDTVGRRTPDSTVSQRRFRFAFLLIVPSANEPSAGQISQVDTYRSLFEGFYERAASDRAKAETTLKHALHLSTFPAAGMVSGSMIAATVSLDSPAATPLNVLLSSDSGAISIPSYVTIAAGASDANFYMMGLRPGVDTITARAVDTSYETAFSRIQIAASPADLQLQTVSNDQPIVLRVTDVNNLPYRNVVVRASVTDGSLDAGMAISDAQGMLRFRWTPSAAATGEFTAAISGGPTLRLALGPR